MDKEKMIEELNNQIFKYDRCPLYKFKTNYVQEMEIQIQRYYL